MHTNIFIKYYMHARFDVRFTEWYRKRYYKQNDMMRLLS